MRPPTSAQVLAQLVAIRDALDVTRLELRDARARATEARAMARDLRTEAQRLRRTARVSFTGLPTAPRQ